MKVSLHVVLVVSLLTQFKIPAAAQLPGYHVKLFDERFGISSVGLQGMVKDQQDFIWLVYHHRVVRFDGKQVREFFPGEKLISILCDNNNRIWLSSATGLYKFENDHAGFRMVRFDAEGDARPGTLFKLPGKPVCLLTSKGFYAYDSAEETFKKLNGTFQDTSSSINIRNLAFSTFGSTAFYCAGNAVYSLTADKGKTDSMPVSDIYSLNALTDHLLLVSNWNNQSFLYNFSAKKIQPISISRHFPHFTDDFFVIRDVLNLDTNRHLLATSKGLIEYNSTTGQFLSKELYVKGNPLPNQQELVDLFLDSNRQVWACTNFNLLSFDPVQQGIGLIRNRESDPEKSFNNHIRGFSADEKGNLWLATANGIAYFNTRKGTIKPYFPEAGSGRSMNHPSIRGILYDGRYVIIGQANRGLWLYDPVSGKYKKPGFLSGPGGESTRRKLSADFIDQLYPLSNGNHVISARDGAYLVNGTNYVITEIEFPGSRENLNFCYEDNKKQVWLGTAKGLHCLDSNLIPLFSVREGIPAATRSLLQLNATEYVLGTKGLYLLKTGTVKAELEKLTPFFDRIVINSIYKDNTNRLWLATDDGLYSYNLQSKRIENFDQFDNVQGNFYYQNSFHLSPGGLLFLGGSNGINYFKPEAVRISEDSLKVIITGLRINEDDSSYASHLHDILELRPAQNSIAIDYTAPYYANTNRLSYRYRLGGLDDGWVYNGTSNTVRFSSLSPGTYTFTAAASVDGEKWFETSKPFSFIIRPPFWDTWWFRVLVIAFLAAVLYRWVQSLREKIRMEKILNYFATSLYGQNTIEDIFWDIARNCISKLKFEDCVIYEYDTERDLLIQKAAYGPKNPEKREIYNPLEIPMGKGIVGAVAQNGKAEIIANTLLDDRYILDDQQRLSEIAVPVHVDGKLFGVIDSEHTRRNYYTKKHLKILTKIADICATKISKYLVEEKLRSRIARDLHDEMGSTLTSVNIISKMAMLRMHQDEQMKDYLHRIKEYSSQMMESMSDIVWAINPANDTFEKIIIRMKEFTSEILDPLQVNYFFSEDEKLNKIQMNPEQRKNIYLIYKEAINNAVKYSEATRVTITLLKENGMMKLSVTDNGKGFDPARTCSGNGIKNMKGRAAEVQARLHINSVKEAGTTVELQLSLT